MLIFGTEKFDRLLCHQLWSLEARFYCIIEAHSRPSNVLYFLGLTDS
jgi:hypothetical protein